MVASDDRISGGEDGDGEMISRCPCVPITFGEIRVNASLRLMASQRFP